MKPSHKIKYFEVNVENDLNNEYISDHDTLEEAVKKGSEAIVGKSQGFILAEACDSAGQVF